MNELGMWLLMSILKRRMQNQLRLGPLPRFPYDPDYNQSTPTWLGGNPVSNVPPDWKEQLSGNLNYGIVPLPNVSPDSLTALMRNMLGSHPVTTPLTYEALMRLRSIMNPEPTGQTGWLGAPPTEKRPRIKLKSPAGEVQ